VSKEGAQYPTAAQLSEQFAQTNHFRHKKENGTKPTKKQDKNPHMKKAEVL
jgi:hypothetical protein